MRNSLRKKKLFLILKENREALENRKKLRLNESLLVPLCSKLHIKGVRHLKIEQISTKIYTIADVFILMA